MRLRPVVNVVMMVPRGRRRRRVVLSVEVVVHLLVIVHLRVAVDPLGRRRAVDRHHGDARRVRPVGPGRGVRGQEQVRREDLQWSIVRVRPGRGSGGHSACKKQEAMKS